MARASLVAACMSVTPLGIADRAGKSFPPHAHVRGFATWQRGEVSIESDEGGAVVAKIRGKRTREVVLRAGNGALLVSCTCPSRALELPGCRHVWAALLEIDRRGALASLRDTRGPLAVSFCAEAADAPAPGTTPKATKARGRASRRSPPATAAPPGPRGKRRPLRPRS